MKKTQKLAVLIVLVFACFLSGFTFFDREEEPEWFLEYAPLRYSIQGDTLYVNGVFRNTSGEYDIVGITEGYIILCDEGGNFLREITVNSAFAKNRLITHDGSVYYNFTCSLSELNIGSVYDLRYSVEGEYTYQECAGKHCDTCGGKAVVAPPLSPEEPEPEPDPATLVKCTKCKGTGVCHECNGSGKNDFTGVLRAAGCALCDRSGDCYKCGGTGFIKVY